MKFSSVVLFLMLILLPTQSFAALLITKVSDLIFPDTMITGVAQNITVAVTDAGAATFNATGGGKNKTFNQRKVVQTSVSLTAPGVAGTIVVDSFTYSSTPNRFDNRGNAVGIKVGATAHILSTTLDGDYSGTLTFRLVSN